ncbi:uncharacterized protein LOC135249061 [Anguilla rostrata]|uniref:uncharacterized protein LOC135249061 n=1 Tax=Anguilla rostrata TaxID=7938 RepID=UPI0030D25C37
MHPTHAHTHTHRYVRLISCAGASFPCTSCRVVAVPQFHLALNDGSIRNFCSYNCVLTFQASLNKVPPQGQVNGSSAAPEPLSAPPSGVPLPPQTSATLPPLSAPRHGQAPPLGPGPVQAPPSPSPRGHGPALPAILPRGPAPAQAPPSLAGGPAPPSHGLVKLSCRQCRRLFSSKPELLQFKGQMVLFCGKLCTEEYRKLNFVTARCEYCKLDKMLRDVVKFNHVDRPFCSEGCKLLFKHDLAKRTGNPCRTCAYCTNTAQKMIQNHFGGKLEEFCKEECMALYTVLFYQMAKCDWCLRQGKLLESQKWLGEMKHFCDLSCLLLFNHQQSSTCDRQHNQSSQSSPYEQPQAQTSPYEQPQAQTSPYEQPYPPSSTYEQQHPPSSTYEQQHPQLSGAIALPPHIPTGAVPACIAPLPPPAGAPAVSHLPVYASKEATPVTLTGAVPTALIQARINGDASTQTDAMKLPAPPRRVLKNKALLCRPISQNKGTMCKPHQKSVESQTDEVHGQKILVLPVPVPVFIPVPMHLYSQYTPLPVGLPVPLPVPLFVPSSLDRTESSAHPAPNSPPDQDMAEEEEGERDKPISYGDQGSTYSGDLESEGLSTPRSWEEEPAPGTQRLGPSDQQDSPAPSATLPLLDLEADFPLESLEPESGKGLSVTLRHRGSRRPRDSFPPRKRVRPASPEPQDLPSTSEPESQDRPCTSKSESKDCPSTSKPESKIARSHLNLKIARSHLNLNLKIARSHLNLNLKIARSHLNLNLKTARPHLNLNLKNARPHLNLNLPRYETLDLVKRRWVSLARPPVSHVPGRKSAWGRKRAAAMVASGVARAAMPPAGRSKLLHMYGVNAWKSWVQSVRENRDKDGQLAWREDVLRCSSAELSVGLCRFIEEVRRPNGERYTPDSIFYLCLGIQQYLFENGRIENLFTDPLYSEFSLQITSMLRDWKPAAVTNGSLLSRVEEEFLWECKQLGAYSPIVLLNTLLFFCTKLLHLQTLPEHRHLAFASLRRVTRQDSHASYLRYTPPPKPRPASEAEMTPLPVKRRLKEAEEDEEEDVMEMPENTENPLRCPVRLYEFYLSKWFPEVTKDEGKEDDRSSAQVDADLEDSDQEEDVDEADLGSSGSEYIPSGDESSGDSFGFEEVAVKEGASLAAGPSPGDSEVPAQDPRPKGLTVKRSNKVPNGKIKWDKRHFCVYCKKSNSKITRHLERKHAAEADVAHALSFPKGSQRRLQLLQQLRHKGDFRHNVAVLKKGDGELVTCKKPGFSAAASDYQPCQYCLGFFLKKDLWRHQGICKFKPETEVKTRKRVQAISSKLLPLPKENVGSCRVVLCKMHPDDVSMQVKKDPLICKFGDMLFAKHGHNETQHQYIAMKMRELARFVLALQKMDGNIEYLRDVIMPSRFDLAVEGARRVAGYDAVADTYKASSVFLKIGYSLRKAVDIAVGESIINDDVTAEGRGKKFIQLLESKWNACISSHTPGSVPRGKLSRCDVVPLTEDVMKLQTFLWESEENAKRELEGNPGPTAWRKLSEVLLLEIAVFNGIREGEVAKMLLETYVKRTKTAADAEDDESLTPLEQHLAEMCTAIEFRGKFGKKISVLLTPSMAASIEVLNSARGTVGVLQDDPHVFARLEVDPPVRGGPRLRKYAADSGTQYPEHLTSAKLRKRVATLCQAMHLREDELDRVAESSGYELGVRPESGSVSENTPQLTKVRELLVAMEKGMSAHHGMPLEELHCPGTDLQPNNDNHIAKMEPGGSESTEPSSESGPCPSAPPEPTSESSPCFTAPTEPTSESGPCSTAPTEPTSESSPCSSAPPEPTSESGPCSTAPTEPSSESGPCSTAPTEPTSEFGPCSTAPTEPASEFGPCSSATTELANAPSPCSSAPTAPESDDGLRKPDSSTPRTRQKAETGADSENAAAQKRQKKKGSWTVAEQTAVKSELQEFIAQMRVPGKKDCEACLEAKPDILHNRSWKDIKYYVYNTIMSNRRRGHTCVVDASERQERGEDECMAKKKKVGYMDR